MEAWLYDLVTSGTDFVLIVQRLRNEFLDAFFRVVTTFGNEEAYLLIVPLVYWVLHKRTGQHVVYLVVLAGFSSSFLKDLFGLPRPFQVDPGVARLVEQGGAGLPSGHAMISLAVWGYVAWRWRKRASWLPILATLFVLCVSFSRIYLGVHFPADIIAGLACGLLILLLWVNRADAFLDWLRGSQGGAAPAVLVLLSLAMILLHPAGDGAYPSENATSVAGLLLGTTIGIAFESRRVGFRVEGAWLQRSLRYFVGLLMVVACWLGLRLAFGAVSSGYLVQILLRFIRYGLTGCALAWWAPALFVRLGLAQRGESAGSEDMLAE